MSQVAITLGCGRTIASTNARAEESEETTESANACVRNNDDKNEDDFIVEFSHEDAARRLDGIDRNGRRRGAVGRDSSCDDLRNNCMRRDDRGDNDGCWGDRCWWDDRRDGTKTYSRYEQRFDVCIEVCRDTR